MHSSESNQSDSNLSAWNDKTEKHNQAATDVDKSAPAITQTRQRIKYAQRSGACATDHKIWQCT